MSYCGALPTGESESHVLIDACLKSVRRQARLDDDPVLPPLSTVVRRHTMLVLSEEGRPETEALPDGGEPSESQTRSVWRRSEVSIPDITGVTPIPRSATGRDTVRRPRTFVQRMRWPVFLCGFIAGIFGGVALMKSPLGRRPAVQRVVKVTQQQASVAYGFVAVKAGLARP